MDKDLIERYKREMMSMYNNKNVAVPTVAEPEKTPPKMDATEPQQPQAPQDTSADSFGGLLGIVTTIKSLYPVENAKVTVFTGGMDNMQVLSADFTDESGRTEVFRLATPKESLSLDSENQIRPYGLYNMMVEADGYLTNIHMNIPVFSGVTSVQSSNMTLLETAGVNKGPQIFDEGQKYNL